MSFCFSHSTRMCLAQVLQVSHCCWRLVEQLRMELHLIWVGMGAALLLIACIIGCRLWKRNRYYKKVQHSLDEEERAFQETLARSYQDDVQLDGGDRETLRMLDTYMMVQATSAQGSALTEELDVGTAQAEDVDRFMAELAAAATGNNSAGTGSTKALPAADEEGVDGANQAQGS
jgi:hypothetical protein